MFCIPCSRHNFSKTGAKSFSLSLKNQIGIVVTSKILNQFNPAHSIQAVIWGHRQHEECKMNFDLDTAIQLVHSISVLFKEAAMALGAVATLLISYRKVRKQLNLLKQKF